jgi:hypothetical protein
VLAILPVFAISHVYATECDDVIGEIRSFNSPAFDEYPQLNDIKSEALLILYSRERGFCPREVVDFAWATKDFLIDFDVIYTLSKSEDINERIKALESVYKLKEKENVLSEIQKKYELGTEAEDIVNSARQAIHAFLDGEAGKYVSRAETTVITKEKILYYKQASLAYSEADKSLEATNYKIKAKVLEEKYTQDMSKADALFSTAKSEYAEAENLLSTEGFLSKYVFSRFNAYILSKNSLTHFQQALGQEYRGYEYHHEEEKILLTKEYISKTKAMKRSLMFQIGAFLAFMAVVFIAIASYIIRHIIAWNEDTYDSSLGNELITVGQK